MPLWVWPAAAAFCAGWALFLRAPQALRRWGLLAGVIVYLVVLFICQRNFLAGAQQCAGNIAQSLNARLGSALPVAQGGSAAQLGLFLLLAALPVTGALAAAALRRYGAETERVRQLFDVTMVEYAAKAELVERARMYRNCAISVGGEIAPEARVAIAQAANDLLRIQGVDASFVAVQVGNGVNVSARSMGAVNVQVIMESLGGGGHQTMAAAQLKHITPQAARSRIQDAIDQYYLSQKKTTPEARPAKGE